MGLVIKAKDGNIKLSDDLEGMRKALLIDAQELARKLEQKEDKKKGRGKIELKPTKLRQYYQAIVHIYEQMKEKEQKDNLWIQFYILKAKVRYDYGREMVTELFEDFITSAVENVKTKEDLEKFKLFFEAVVGFFPKSTSS